MKKAFLVFAALFSLSLSGCTASTNSHPTESEWLEVYLSHEIRETTDLWSTRVSIATLIYPQDKEIIVSITEANGEDLLRDSAKESYVSTCKSITESVLEKYKWASDYKVIVQFI